MGHVTYRMGSLSIAFEEAKDHLVRVDAGRRLWERDATLWTGSDEDRWLGWLDAPVKATTWATEAAVLLPEARKADVDDVVLLGMGGSSLCPEVLAWTFGDQVDGPRLSVLDSTAPDQILGIDARIDLAKTWFVVASKLGSTTEPNALLEYFYDRTGNAGARFIAITDPGSSLESVARARRFRHIFHGEPDIGGRFSALSHFGLVPAALAGIDLGRFLRSATTVRAQCASEIPVESNPGLTLGAAIGAAARSGRDKLTLRLSPSIQRLGVWVEQLVAESTGKHDLGICPVVDEPDRFPASYASDRIFVFVQIGEDPGLIERADKLVAAGHPVVTITLDDTWALSGELFRWEIATAAIGVLLGINPFDQPNVQESKDITASLISDYVSSGKVPDEDPTGTDKGIKVYTTDSVDATHTISEIFARFFREVAIPDYVALCAFVDMRPDVEEALQSLRKLIGERLKVATTLGFGPRFLHSTGQLHKGGPNSGVFVHITCEPSCDASVPELGYSFDALNRAQALGDIQALVGRKRRVLRCHLDEIDRGLGQLEEAFRRALPKER